MNEHTVETVQGEESVDEENSLTATTSDEKDNNNVSKALIAMTNKLIEEEN